MQKSVYQEYSTLIRQVLLDLIEYQVRYIYFLILELDSDTILIWWFSALVSDLIRLVYIKF